MLSMAVVYLVEPLGYEHVTGFVEPEGLPIIINFYMNSDHVCTCWSAFANCSCYKGASDFWESLYLG